MKLATNALLLTLLMLTAVFGVSAQLSDKDDRNTAPTVGTGGPVGGPTGLFTVYDAKTLRKGEHTLSAALSNYDRDPGDVDISSVPLSFQIGLSNRFELFFSTEAYRGIKVNSPRNLSGFYMPNSLVLINGVLRSAPAIVLAPQGAGPSVYTNSGVFRPTGMPFTQFPYTGGNAGTYGFQPPFFSGPFFGFPAGTNALLGGPRAGGAADLFPGVGSPFGSILPGIVLTTETITNAGLPRGEGPVSFSSAPTYIADAPFINRRWGQTAFNTLEGGFKWRFNKSTAAAGWGLTGFYRYYLDTADSLAGFNQMQRGSGGGGNMGDIGLTMFADARVTSWANVSANVGYVYTSKAKGSFGGSDFTILDRPDELQVAVGVDFPVNKYFQPILEFRSLTYVGGRTPNALEQHPFDGLAGVRIFPRRWFGFGFAYRHNFNQQDADFFDGDSTSASVFLPCAPGSTGCQPLTVVRQSTGVPSGLRTSNDPHGYIAQFWVGRRDKRQGSVENKFANVDSVSLSDEVITLPCPAGTRSRSGQCNDRATIDVTTRATDPEGDPLVYNYTVNGGRIVGSGANVQWDLSGAQPGTYTVTVGVDDGCGICGRTETKTIRIENCNDCFTPCECPTLSVSGPSGITRPGDTMTFTAMSGGNVTYNWVVSDGTIVSGQGTPSITVATTADMAGRNITATVTIGGFEDCNCVKSASDTGSIADRVTSTLIDEFGRQVDDEVKARVDNFYIQLNNNPTAQGYIINYGTAADIRRRRAQIMKAINFRRYDVSRVTFIDGPNNQGGVFTKFYLVPSGADVPMP